AEARSRMQDRLNAPVLAYRANAGIEGQSEDLFPNFGVGVGLSLPIWDAGASKAAEAGARAEAAELAAQTEAERARQRKLQSQRKLQAEHALRLLGLAERGLALAEARVQQLESGTTLANAEQEALASAEADRARARADVVRARAGCAQLQLGLQ
ncbi:MAG TPA: TolC family protein, partial [Polyangiales bacterium]|nr:TolC family protein [Polyangiales bacterium]